jgi:hypothetical protein
LTIKASQAGGKATCRCGRVLSVPRLSQLRVAAGEPAHETNVREAIARMIEAGELPWGQCCAVTQMLTDDVMWFEVQCEASYTTGGGRVHWLLALWCLVIPWGVLALAWRVRERSEQFGRDIVISVPLRVSREKQAGLARASQSHLRRLMSSVPVYEELFREHPHARIVAR